MIFDEMLAQSNQSLARGIIVGTINSIADPQNLGRVKVNFLLYGNQIESDWIRICSYFAGANRGAFFLPQENDEVLLAFVNDDPSIPYVIGFLWNGQDLPPVTKEQQPNLRVIKTKQGNTISFDDTPDKEIITITDAKNNQIVINSAENKLSIISQGSIEIKANKSITLNAESLQITTTGTTKMESNGIEISGGEDIKLSAEMINLN